MGDNADPTILVSGDNDVSSSSAFTIHERKQTDRGVFIYTSFHGDAGPPAPPPLPVPRIVDNTGDAPAQSGASALNSVFVMANSTVGAGVLSLPFAFQETEALTLYVLSKFAERYSAVTYVELVRRALGRKLAVLLSAVLVVAMFGACVAYLIILADNLTSLAAAAGLPVWISDRHNVVAVLGLGVLLPLCLPRQMSALAAMSRVAVLGFLVGAALVSFRGLQGPASMGFPCIMSILLGTSPQVALERPKLMEGVKLFNIGYQTLFAIPIVVFGFNCHAMVVTIFHELERFRYIPRPKTRKLVGMLGVIMASSCLVMLVYVVVGSTGYLAFPGHVDTNILKSFSYGDVMLQIARAFITVIVLGSYPLTHHPARAGFEHLPVGVPFVLSIAFTLVFVVGSTAVAEVVSDLGFVLNLLGGLCISFIIFFIPGLLLINAAIVKHSTEVLETLEGQVDDEADVTDTQSADLKRPLLIRLQSAREKGIKKGITYAPRLSWMFGSLLVVLGILIAGVTVSTVLLGRS
ncbi:hypothetical protein VOLCADRAFT_127346 [Volvox carteri f. nagariensis]|uniref:Uncharacterized protein aot5 n=1 Tax=Volvox carteri f. nagariensis TaxID=3068 RepID=D8THU6_VOLCA|nr:uncharacterized protein VOLCADRAFT_127346 [Volvox carteri f. nagariensis]EFJ53128.1 hypothetical protein VOLCADRAFT_127346 [Volvox carteri f. nagariensis]|eukprot:XP_002946133.1 hypothetical protein VOLCADRAFT_127346 [Volvox carteri f. nagariensis]